MAKYSVKQAAVLLQVRDASVRTRMKRGTLKGELTKKGWVVEISDAEIAAAKERKAARDAASTIEGGWEEVSGDEKEQKAAGAPTEDANETKEGAEAPESKTVEKVLTPEVNAVDEKVVKKEPVLVEPDKSLQDVLDADKGVKGVVNEQKQEPAKSAKPEPKKQESTDASAAARTARESKTDAANKPGERAAHHASADKPDTRAEPKWWF